MPAVTEPKKNLKEEILRVAEAMFCQYGYDATTFQKIADELHITKGSITYHFKNKHFIMGTLFEEYFAALRAHIDSFPDAYRDAYWRYSVMYIYAYRAIMASPCTRGLFYHKNQMSLWEVTEVATMENIYRDIAEDFHKEFTEEDLRITAYLDLGARRRMYREYLTDSSFLPIDRYCYYHVYHMGLLARLDEATITRDIQDAFAFADAHTPPTVPILCGQP
ncbi:MULTISPECIES: TetR family transcriptional regulator [Eubacteriales]|uniref:TetR family transcriptional regulator n=1 Tax=Eubacteriales TaxID=186802 RepID=UPI000B37C4B1|nr:MULTISPECIES: TetR family transcriptional regulator [Eubacteriales]OUN86923.1 hypothetical protein B5G03_06785 [Gemmiger sp. An50]